MRLRSCRLGSDTLPLREQDSFVAWRRMFTPSPEAITHEERLWAPRAGVEARVGPQTMTPASPSPCAPISLAQPHVVAFTIYRRPSFFGGPTARSSRRRCSLRTRLMLSEAPHTGWNGWGAGARR